ncbi:MAG: MFS transporter [Acetobacteraceae bacterium]|nr:MFS transporter [Acetobacteraceae bacterium]
MTDTADAAQDDGSPAWRVTLWAMIAVQVIMSLSFTFLSPVMPLYLPELGVQTDFHLYLWSGLLGSVTSLVAAFTAPMWGRMSDRLGRKLMVLRSAFAISVCTALMGLAMNVWQLLAARLLMGAFAGFSAASVVLIASQVPQRKLATSLGLMSTAQLVGSLVGPVVGGGLADLTGSYRLVFFCGAGLSMTAFLLAWWLVPESFSPPKTGAKPRSILASMRLLVANGAMAALVLVLLLTQFATQAVQPVVALYVQDMVGDRPDLATLSGVALSVTGLAGIIAVPLLSRATERFGEKRIIMFALVGAALMTAPQALSPTYLIFVAERFGLGLFIGSIVPITNALIGRLTSPEERGFTYGMTSSAYFLGNSMGPITGGTVAAFVGLPWVFVLTTVLLLLSVAWVAVAVPGRR